MKRAEILEQARKCVCGEREREYGRPENNFALIGKLWEGVHRNALQREGRCYDAGAPEGGPHQDRRQG